MTIQILHGDCREVLQTLPAESVQTVCTSPPYFGLRSYNGGDAEIGTEETPAEYVAALVDVFRQVRRVLRRDGVLWLNLGDSFQNKQQQLIPHRVALALQADGWILRSTVVWHKPNCMPSSVCDRPTDSHEYIFLLTKAERYFYDADAIREGWTDERNGASGAKASKYIDAGAKRNDGGVTSIPTVSGRNKRTVWTIPTAPYPGAHFATWPEKLVELMVLAGSSPQACECCGAPWRRVVERESAPPEVFTKRNAPTDELTYAGSRVNGEMRGQGQKLQNWRDEHPPITTGWAATCTCPNVGSARSVVLDCFAGSGTTLRVADRHGRDAIGVELNQDYLAQIEARTNGVQTSMVSLID